MNSVVFPSSTLFLLWIYLSKMSTRVLSVPVSSYGYGRPRIVPSPVCLTRVKRCLFGLSSSPEEALQQAAAELQRQTEADSRKYNFDFVREKPLDGPFKWQPEPQANDQHPASPTQRLRQSQITGNLAFFPIRAPPSRINRST